ncbi:MAG: hypothetical protein JW958_03460 [Candidatus Eisenbacteria bacterium]|nr:hypothetical protein [Candidatus Eisenbacteria bacterium]
MMSIHRLFAVLFLLSAIGIFDGCDTVSTTGPDGNQPPETWLSGGPEPFDAISYRADLHWTGSDSDGDVVYYEYAVDDTTEWTRVIGGSSEFLFSCGEEPLFDTLTAASGADSVVERSGAFHSFWVRAVDNEGARDPSPAWICFNATTVLPWSRITQGPMQSGMSGTSVRIRWEGFDPDGTTGPIGYEYFYAVKSTMREVYGYEDATGVTREVWNSLDWNRVGADCTHVDLRNLTTGYGEDGGNRSMFFVRAVDEAGSVEQITEPYRNWIEWGVGRMPPQIVIHSNWMGTAMGSLQYTGIAFAGSRPRFAWTMNGSLDPWALDLDGFRYAYDAPEWTPSIGYDAGLTAFPPEGETFILEEIGHHVFYVEASFLPEGTEICEFSFDVYPSPAAETNIFLLNDFYVPGYPGQYPSPGSYVALWEDTLLAGFSRLPTRTPRMEEDTDPPIQRMAGASTVILTLDDWEFGTTMTAVWNDNNSNPIWSYADAGGNLFVVGFMPGWSFLPDRDMDLSGTEPEYAPCLDYSAYSACGGYLVWHQPHWPDLGPKTSLYNPVPHPLYEFCALETTWLDQGSDFLVSAEALHAGFPDLHIDTTRSTLLAAYPGLWNCEELTVRSDVGAVPLYAPVREEGGAAASRPNAVWIPSDGHRGHVVYMSMPLYFFPPGEAREVVETILEDLFGEVSRK